MATGNISKNMVLLWENPGTSISGNISLSSDDYDYLIVEFRLSSSDPTISQLIFKGQSTRLFLCQAVNNSASDSLFASRNMTRISDTEFNLSTGVIARNNQQTTYGDHFCYPTRIFGIKA